ncbi:hypothetical protein A2U01_0071522, partial [Trifolium medium]|nr:hypothetical protein [Trifolium medium]
MAEQWRKLVDSRRSYDFCFLFAQPSCKPNREKEKGGRVWCHREKEKEARGGRRWEGQIGARR